MTKAEAVNWIINLTADIGKIEYQSLWHYEQALSEIREMLEIKPERKWIPCSERLPEENIPVLLGVRFKDDFKYFVTARMDYNYWTGLGRDIRGKLAWMPLPEPYREVEYDSQ